jgi:hypothetical protein
LVDADLYAYDSITFGTFSTCECPLGIFQIGDFHLPRLILMFSTYKIFAMNGLLLYLLSGYDSKVPKFNACICGATNVTHDMILISNLIPVVSTYVSVIDDLYRFYSHFTVPRKPLNKPETRKSTNTEPEPQHH